MKKLELGKDLTLPLEAVTQTIAILAKRRAGKSYLMRRLVEQLFGAGQQVVLIDPKGDQWGVRSAADGKAPGLPIVILGGERGDVPLESSSGEVVAKLVVEERVSVLLDLSTFRKHEVATFMTAFMENLYRLKAREVYRTPMMLVIDEADAVAPQKPQKGEERMLGAAEDIVRRGGQRGIGCVLVTQRSAVLNKNVLTQAQMLVALRTIAPQDLAAMNAWIDVHGTPEQRKTLMESLPSLPVGDAWFWSPGWPTADGIFKRTHVLPIETFDSGKSPEPGVKPVEPKNLADVDLDALKGQMAATIEKAKADDPKLLRARIRELEGQVNVKKAPAASAAEKIIEKVVEVQVLKDAQLRRAEGLLARLQEHGERFLAEAAALRQSIAAAAAPQRRAAPAPAPVQRRSIPAPAVARAAPAHRANGSGAHGEPLPKGERRILAACIQFPAGLRREQLTVLTTFKRSTRDRYILYLKEKGYVDQVGEVVNATDAGRAALPDAEPLPTGEALRDYWLARLPEGERKILEALIAAYPKAIQRDDLSEATGYQRSTRDRYLLYMRNKQLIEEPSRGEVRASEGLFE